MLAAIDVGYEGLHAVAAALSFADWETATSTTESRIRLPVPADYEPGQFYRRELPCLLSVLETLPDSPCTILIDGYVWLGPDRPGLGMHLWKALGGHVAVVGVAKSHFEGATSAVPVLRGASTRPLFVTSEGLPVATAATHVGRMHGEFRIPTLLKRVDALSRTGAAEGTGT